VCVCVCVCACARARARVRVRVRVCVCVAVKVVSSYGYDPQVMLRGTVASIGITVSTLPKTKFHF
jgi:hypothetical protein